MKLTKAQKIEKSKAAAAKLRAAQHIFITEYQGLKFRELDALRGKLRPAKSKFSIVKNSMLRQALKGAGVDGAEAHVKGPTGLAVVDGDDPVAAARVLVAFAKEFPALKLRAGFVGRQWLASAECARLAALGTKPEMLAKLAGALASAIVRAANVLQAPIRDLGLALRALEDKKKAAAAV